MSYLDGVAALISLCLSGVLLFATLSWLVTHQRTRLTTAWLAGLLILVVLQSLEFLYYAQDWFYQWPFFLKLADPLVILIPFTIYGYIRALLGENISRPRTRLLLHFIPVFVVALFDIPYWNLPADERIYWAILVRSDESAWEPLAPYGNDYLAIIALLGFVYWHHQRKIGTGLPTGSKLNLWIDKLQWLQLVVCASLVSRIILSTVFGTHISMVYTMAPAIAWLLFQVLLYTQLPQDKANKTVAPSHTKNLPSLEQPPAEVASTVPTPAAESDHLSPLFAELEKLMLEGIYTDNDLSLSKVASLCGLTTHQASAAINQCYGANFYDWVNSYRVQAAQQVLKNSEISVAQICFEVGFNSKSTFYTAFKKISGCTPSQYRSR